MVVQRKAPIAPVPTASRHNSSHAVPKASKPKQPSTLTNGSSAVAPKEPQTSPSSQNGASTSSKSHSKSKHKNRHPDKKPPKSSRSILDRLGLLVLGLFVFYAFRTCPQDTHLSNPICRSLSQYRTHVLEPYVIPQLNRAISHPSIAPYVVKAEQIERETVRPIVVKTVQVTGPYVAATKRITWDKTAVPLFNAYVVPQYHKHVLPQWNKHVVSQWRKHVSPQLQRVQPHFSRAQRTIQTSAIVGRKLYITRIQPALVKAYALTKPYVVKTYVIVKPRALAFYGALSARTGEARRAYVDPHVVRIWEKVLELSGAGPIGSPVVPAQKPAASNVVSSSTESTIQQSSTPVPQQEETPSVLPSSTPAETLEVAPSAETTSTVQATTSSSVIEPESTVAAAQAEPETSSIVPTTATTTAVPVESVEAEIAAASIAIQSAHGMESPVVESMLEDIKVKAPALATPTPLQEDEDDEDVSDFLDDLGISPDVPPPEETFVYEDEDVELTPAEIMALKRKQDEEQRVAKERETREKRADLEGRMAKSNAELTALSKQKNKELRKSLVAIRKAAVAKLNDENSTIGKLIPELEKETEKIFKGLEGYLKKELKSSKGIVSERIDKWSNVVDKVEERLGEKVQVAQNTLHEFHSDVKAREFEMGMALIEEVKAACGQAQADVGLELSWLHDVTYMDWQVYHDLARIGEKFQAEASEIQAGTHAHPPSDPFIKKYGEIETYMGAVVSGIIDRVTVLRGEGETAIAKAALPPKASAPVPEPEQPEPEVSILPIDDKTPPAPTTDQEFEADQVIIGKSAEQVEEALRRASDTDPSVHQEL
ncbi:hypothetical protein MIND_00315900 [Mycena indigotica]|uniref:Uncharacterized protein n=1 Tax=Mycena indigotica TaxID=2126181 RepID=A0A8H6WAS4_9AGAR|nr:uncharacterized protein MIND_00315900 [Mycena indigotica]KAF7309451.1 hypothetical protein MIND_00315900 [Mycena indigotica]